jgi:hypothetical protein
LPIRTRGASEQPALDGPTFPIGLPVAAVRPAAAGAASPAPPEAGTAPAAAESAPANGAAEAGTGATAGGGPARTARPEQARADSGLPVRVRQASLVPELRDEPAADGHDDEDAVRPPDQVRRMMSSYQTGTRRGRTDAARLLGGAGDGRAEAGEGAEAAEGPDVGDQQAT